MNEQVLADGLISFVCFIIIVTFHEWGHAWTALKFGDDTAYQMGRVSLNPAAHIDAFGTIIFPLASVLFAATGFGGIAGLLLGWGRPVPVNLSRLKNRFWADIIVSLAGPIMNLVLVLIALPLMWIAQHFNQKMVVEFGTDLVRLSLFLFFFNMLPIPPLDGSRVARRLVGMKEETFAKIAQYGIYMLIIAINIPPIMIGLVLATEISSLVLGRLFGLPLSEINLGQIG